MGPGAQQARRQRARLCRRASVHALATVNNSRRKTNLGETRHVGYYCAADVAAAAAAWRVFARVAGALSRGDGCIRIIIHLNKSTCH